MKRYITKDMMQMQTRYYIAANSKTERGGIYGYSSRSEPTFFEPLPGVSYLAFSPDRKLLYTTSKGDLNYAGIYRIREDGSLEYLDRRDTHGQSACHITTDPAGEFLYCANYRTGTFNEFHLKDGLFQGESSERYFEMQGKLGPNPDRQEHAHAHCTVFTPDGKYLCIVDLGLDEVQLFAFTPGKGIQEKPVFRYRSINPGAGPRHLLFSPDGKTAWLANEVDNTVSVLSYRDGTLTHRNTISTLPPDFKDYSKASAIRLSPDGKFLCVSNRGYDSFACYEVDAAGDLKLHCIVPSNGVSPRDVNFLPGGTEFVCCNETPGSVTFFQYQNGEFVPEKRQFDLPGALCCLPV